VSVGRFARWRFSLAGAALGAIAGVAAVALASAALADRIVAGHAEPLLEAAHLPPLLTVPGERVELRYDVFCVLPEAAPEAPDAPDAPCDVRGEVFVRAGDVGAFRGIPLRETDAGSDARFVAVVPGALARAPAGFSYYAVLRNASAGTSVTIPAGGPAAPQRSRPLAGAVDIALGAHVFGRTRRATIRVAEAAWGDGAANVGLEQGRNLAPIGGSSFDVANDGTVFVLDEANRRGLRWRAGELVPGSVSLDVNGTLADMSVAQDGTIFVLETTGRGGKAPLLRSFGADGAPKGATEMAERASQVRVGPGGPVVLQTVSGQWKAAADERGLLPPAAQRGIGRAGRPLLGGGEVVVLRGEGEVRVAHVGPAGVERSWRVTSETPLAEVQLAEPVGSRVLLVVRAYSETRDEFLVLLLGTRGLVDTFAVDSADWAETAPLSRFRVAGSSLYRLGSDPAGLFVDRFDLEVR
jgi:hypothetical protein